MSLLHQQKSFLETNAWQKSNLNSLRYNTSQVGSVLPLGWGTFRQQVNLIALGDYRGPSGKKGKNGPLPLAGTHTGKGGAGGSKKGAGGKKSSDYSVDVDFAICQGPVDIGDTNRVWASAGIAFFQSVGLNLYTGEDGQAADPVFASLDMPDNYSGTCHVTGTPMDLGSSPVLPNLSFEVTGFEVGTCGDAYPLDANPANVVQDFLTNARYGAGWPAANLDPDIATPGTNNYGDYCQSALLAISPVLQSQTDAASYVSELARLTNTAIVWSGSVLKFIPYGDIALDANGATWEPNLTPLYSFDDDDFLPWNPHIDASDPQLGEDDPVIITRSNPADATNWTSIEYLDRENDYNKTVIPEFDQATIDLHGIRTDAAIQGNCFCNKTPAATSARLILQRQLYQRNTYRFQVGWQYMLLEPMDIVLLTDERCGLDEQPVRITAIEENENGDLIIDAEEIVVAPGEVLAPTAPERSLRVSFYTSMLFSPLAGAVNSRRGTFSIDILPDEFSDRPEYIGLFRDTFSYAWPRFGVFFSPNGNIALSLAGAGGALQAISIPNAIVAGKWQNLLLSWDLTGAAPIIQCRVNGKSVAMPVIASTGALTFEVGFADVTGGGHGWWQTFSGGNLTPTSGRYFGGVQDLYLNIEDHFDLDDPANLKKFYFRGHARRLGDNGELPSGSPPIVFFHWTEGDPVWNFKTNLGTGGGFTPWGYPFEIIDSNPYG